MNYKRLEDFDLDWTKSYSKEYYENIINQMDPNDASRKILESGLLIIESRAFDNAIGIVHER